MPKCFYLLQATPLTPVFVLQKKGAADQGVNTVHYHSTPQAFWLTCLKCGIAKQFQNVKRDTNKFIGSDHSLTNLAITEFFSSYCNTKRNFLINQQISQILVNVSDIQNEDYKDISQAKC